MTDRYSEAEIARIKAGVDMAAVIGATVALKRQGEEFTGLCPFHNESTPSFNVVPKKQMYYCFGCGATGDIFKWLQERERLSFAEAMQKINAGSFTRAKAMPAANPIHAPADDIAEQLRRVEKARKIWKESDAAKGSLVEKYLQSRGLDGAPIPPTIRFHPKLWNAEKSLLMPAMIGAVAHNSKKITGIHRTYLRPDGTGKIDGKAKMMLGQCRDGHVWITSSAPRLAIAEGIETALSVKKACPDLAVWAALSLNNMAAPVPAEVTEIILCADADNKDQRMADSVLKTAARIHMRPGRTIRIARPKDGCDFNDMIMGAA